MQRYSAATLALLATLGLSVVAQAQSTNQQSVEELRNTLVSVMEALVQKGLLTSEQAQKIVANAQDKAAADAKAKAEQEEAEKDAVVVKRIPETVKQDIAKQVSAELRPLVKEDVLKDAQDKKWGVPGAMPDWLSRIKLSGDIRVREQYDRFAAGNAIDEGNGNIVKDTYFNYPAVNKAGGKSAAGENAFLNTTENRLRTRLRARLAVDAKVSDGITATIRLATGSLTDPVSTNQTLGQNGNRYQFAVDQAYLRYSVFGEAKIPWLTATLGRAPNPWVSTDLVWDPDLQFEGVASTWRYVMEKDSTLPRNVFMTVGAFPLQEIEISSKDKWLYGAQLGFDFPWDGGGRLQLAGSYYYFDNITGERADINTPRLDYTAPEFMQKGNTLFDIDIDLGKELYALAAEYHLVGMTAMLELPLFEHQLTLTGDYVKNIGYDQQEILQRAGFASLDQVEEERRKDFNERTTGWQVELAFGSKRTGKQGSWRGAVAYKKLDRDAVVDAYTDSDFHLGGTDAKGYVLRADWWFRDRNWLTLRYLSSDEIARSQFNSAGTKLIQEALPFGVDTLMLDINAQF